MRYYAKGLDAEGNEYRVAWETTKAWDAQQEAYRADPENFFLSIEEEYACDWDTPVEATMNCPSSFNEA